MPTCSDCQTEYSEEYAYCHECGSVHRADEKTFAMDERDALSRVAFAVHLFGSHIVYVLLAACTSALIVYGASRLIPQEYMGSPLAIAVLCPLGAISLFASGSILGYIRGNKMRHAGIWAAWAIAAIACAAAFSKGFREFGMETAVIATMFYLLGAVPTSLAKSGKQTGQRGYLLTAFEINLGAGIFMFVIVFFIAAISLHGK